MLNTKVEFVTEKMYSPRHREDLRVVHCFDDLPSLWLVGGKVGEQERQINFAKTYAVTRNHVSRDMFAGIH